MANVPIQEITQQDLQDPNLSVINNLFRTMAIEINRLGGNIPKTNIVLNGNIDLQGKYKVINSAP
jgi:hypothetical protein